MNDELVERVARAIAEVFWSAFPINEPGRKEWWIDSNWENYADQARAVLTALRPELEDASRLHRAIRHAADIGYKKGRAGVVSFTTDDHDIDSTVANAFKWADQDATRQEGL